MTKTKVQKVNATIPEEKIIKSAAKLLAEGGFVAFPTETVYGIGVNFLNESAIKKLYEIKNRPKNKPFTIHIASVDTIHALHCKIPSLAVQLMKNFWPGPLTIILKSDVRKLAFRMPDNKIAKALIRESNVPVAAPSANISGEAPPTRAEEVIKSFDGKIDLVLDGGQTELGKESTIIDTTSFPYTMLREGAISEGKIIKVCSKTYGPTFTLAKDYKIPASAPGKNKLKNIKKVLVVCTGNSCRSIMAEAYLTKRLEDEGIDNISVVSFGTGAIPGLRPSKEAIQVMNEEGIDVSGYVSSSLDISHIKGADIILVMNPYHREKILVFVPEAARKTFLLREFASTQSQKNKIIPDPIGSSVEFYRRILEIIKDSVEGFVKWIKE